MTRTGAPACPRNGGHIIRLIGPVERATGADGAVTYWVKISCPACKAKKDEVRVGEEWALTAKRPVVDR